MGTLEARTPIKIKEGEDLFNRLGVAFSDHKIFSAKHPRFLESCQSFLDAIDSFFESHPDQKHVLFVHRRGQIYFRKVPLVTLTPPAIKLAKLLGAKEVEGLRFGPGCGLTAVSHLIDGLHRFTASEEPVWQKVNHELEAKGLKSRLGLFTDQELSNLEDCGGVLASEEEVIFRGPAILSLPQLELPFEVYKNSLAALHDIMSLVGAGGSPEFGPALEAAHHLSTGVFQDSQVWLPLTSVQYEDQFTFNHSVNVCLLVVAALRPLVRDPDQLARVGQAALLHDLGKTLVPQDLLYSDRALAGDERQAIERHPALGADILADTSAVDPLAVVIAHDHHRRAGGRGYPAPRRDRPIDSLTTLVAAADIFEALTAERPYKRRLTPSEAFQVFLRLPEARGLEEGVRLLFDALSPYPPGSFVELDSGELAIVTRTQAATPQAPFVRLVAREGDRFIVAPDEIDLSMRGPGTPHIHRALPADWDPTQAAEEESIDEEELELETRVLSGTLLVSEG